MLPVTLAVLNDTREAWRAEDGYALGYQLFDPATGVLIVEGRRVPLPQPVAAGQSVSFALELHLPPEAGAYRAFVCVLHEPSGWLYERGKPFLLLEVEVPTSGAPAVLRTETTTLGRLVRRAKLRAAARSLVLPFQSAWRHRSLIRTLVQRDILGRYRGSFGGVFWTLLNPLLLMLTYFFVFGVVLKARFANDNSTSGFALYFLAGMLPWLAFSEAAGRAPVVLHENKTLIKKVVFPLDILPVNTVIAGLVSEAFGLALFLIALLLIRGSVPLTALWLPVLIVPQLLFSVGVAWLLAALGAFVRDLAQINGFLLTLWFFLTPICYPETQVPPFAAGLLWLNPVYELVRGYRAVLLEHHAPDWHMTAQLWAVGLLFCLIGHASYHKLRFTFADVI